MFSRRARIASWLLVWAVSGASNAAGAVTVTVPPTVVGPPSPQTTAAPPRTTIAREAGEVRVFTTCPTRTDPQTPADVAVIVQSQERLSSTAQQIRQYAGTQPLTFGDIRRVGPGNSLIAVSFTADLNAHARALQGLVDLPNSVVVCPAPMTSASLVALANELVSRAGAAMIGGSLTPTDGVPVIVLRADRREVADALVRDYGARVQVVLGNFAYPDPAVARRDTTVPLACGEIPSSDARSKSLAWSVPKPLRVHSGGDLRTLLTIRNVGRRAVTVTTGEPIYGVVTTVGSTRLVARYSGASNMPSFNETLRSGGRIRVTGELSTASCDPALGHALPPGRYSVRFVFGGSDRIATGATGTFPVVSTPIPLTITNDAAPPSPAPPPFSPVTLSP